MLQQTKGKGVDLVLNSLAEEKLQASVRCLAKHGRFLEIGKLDLSNNTPLGTDLIIYYFNFINFCSRQVSSNMLNSASTGMSVFLKNTTFHGILLDSLFDASSDDPDKKAVVKLLSDGLKNGAVRPLQTTVFSEQQVEQAFRYRISSLFENIK